MRSHLRILELRLQLLGVYGIPPAAWAKGRIKNEGNTQSAAAKALPFSHLKCGHRLAAHRLSPHIGTLPNYFEIRRRFVAGVLGSVVADSILHGLLEFVRDEVLAEIYMLYGR